MIEVKRFSLFNQRRFEYQFTINQGPLIKLGDIIPYEGHQYMVVSDPVGHVNGLERSISLETIFRAVRL